jgi:hypothetical protein
LTKHPPQVDKATVPHASGAGAPEITQEMICAGERVIEDARDACMVLPDLLAIRVYQEMYRLAPTKKG